MTMKKTKPAVVTTATEATADAIAAGRDGAGPATGPARARRGGKGAKAANAATPARKPRRKPAVADDGAKTVRKPRTGTKQERLIAMLRVKDGATVEEIATTFGWAPHTVRGALYGALKKKLGLDVVSEKVQGRGRVYRIGS